MSTFRRTLALAVALLLTFTLAQPAQASTDVTIYASVIGSTVWQGRPYFHATTDGKFLSGSIRINCRKDSHGHGPTQELVALWRQKSNGDWVHDRHQYKPCNGGAASPLVLGLIAKDVNYRIKLANRDESAGSAWVVVYLT